MKKRKSRLLKRGEQLNLYKTSEGLLYWLDPKKYLDASIIKYGYFEPESTQLVKKVIKQGDVVLDVGANIGYFSLLFAKLASPGGKVFCFEPTTRYGSILERNIASNGFENILVKKFALSDSESSQEINIGDSSATIHWTASSKPKSVETIQLKRLDDIVDDLSIEKMDFVKVDIDGHEPQFLEGAWDSIERFRPIILLEVNHDNYVNAGYNAMDFYTMLKDKGFYIYSEKTFKEYESMRAFLLECGNFTFSANVILSFKKLDLI